MDERGGELMLVSPRLLDRISLDGLPAIVTHVFRCGSPRIIRR